MSALHLALALLPGCPEEPPDMAAQLREPGAAQEQQGGEGVPPPPDGEAGPAAGAADGQPADGAPPEGAPPGELPSFELGEETITIRGTVAGAAQGQVDFLVIEEEEGVQRPRVLHVATLEGGAFEVVAPATWEGPIHVSVLVDETGDGPDPTDPAGGLDEPITLSGSDLVLELSVDHTPAWLEALHASAAELDAAADPVEATAAGGPE